MEFGHFWPTRSLLSAKKFAKKTAGYTAVSKCAKLKDLSKQIAAKCVSTLHHTKRRSVLYVCLCTNFRLFCRNWRSLKLQNVFLLISVKTIETFFFPFVRRCVIVLEHSLDNFPISCNNIALCTVRIHTELPLCQHAFHLWVTGQQLSHQEKNLNQQRNLFVDMDAAARVRRHC